MNFARRLDPAIFNWIVLKTLWNTASQVPHSFDQFDGLCPGLACLGEDSNQNRR